MADPRRKRLPGYEEAVDMNRMVARWDALRVLSIAVAVQASGCMSQQLRFTAVRNLSILPELQYQQVVDNLAKIAVNPAFLPYLAVVGQGSVQVTDNGNSALGLNLPKNALGAGTFGFAASRNVTGTWSMGTVTSPEKIRSMQAVYLRALRGAAEGDPAFGWLKVGRKEQLPKQVSYLGRHENTVAWVERDGVEGLSDLTLAILDIATREDTGGTPVSDTGSLHGLAQAPGAPRRNFQVPPVGPLYTPGTN
jgi:hypothetical protein